jgi:peptidoglycan/xylan/chitin deacetylase (PgdA/CDA1 family)
MVCVELSIDDGAVSDLEVAAILSKYNAKATFYIPNFNIEGLSILTRSQIIDISENFQIGGHGTTHRYLDQLSNRVELVRELKINKDFLESVTQRTIHNFCFPGGKLSQKITNAVWDVGYKSARTTKNFSYKRRVGGVINTSFQFYPHNQLTLTKNLFKNAQIGSPYAMLCGISSFSKRLDYIYKLIDLQKVDYLGVWLHSWELQKFNGFSLLDQFLKSLAAREVVYRNIT